MTLAIGGLATRIPLELIVYPAVFKPRMMRTPPPGVILPAGVGAPLSVSPEAGRVSLL